MKVLLGQPQLLKLKPLTAIDAISARDTGRLGLNVLSGYPAITLFSASKLISHPAQNPAGTSSNEEAPVIGEAPPVIGGLKGTMDLFTTSMPEGVCISIGQVPVATGAAPPVIT